MARNPGLRPGVNGHPNLSLVLPSTQSSHQSFGPPGEGRSPVTSETTGVRHTEPSSAQSRSQNESAVLTPTSATNQSETNSQVIFGLRDSQVQHHSGLGPPGFSERASAWSSVKEFQPTFSSSQSRTIGNSRLDVSRKPFVSLATPRSQATSTHRDLQTIWKEHERRAKQAQIYAQDDYRPSLPTILPSVEANSRGHQLDGEQFRSSAAIGELENMFQNLGNDTEHRDHSYRRGSASWAIHSRCSTVRSTGPRERRECDENAREEWGRNPHHHYQPFLSPNVAPGQHCYDTINHHHSSTLPNVSTHLDGNPTRAMLSYDASLVEPGIGNTRRTRQIYADFTRHDGHIFGQNTCGNGMYGPDVAVRTDPRQAGCTFQSGLTAPFTICDPQIDRQHEPTQIVRSQLLEEFRMNGKTKKYELRDIYDHIVEFSGDQLGSRFIQNKLEIANSDEKDRVFQEIATDSRQLMTDVFGNYVIQKMFEHGDQSQKKVLASHMKGHVYALSTQTYGCRVVQKALEHILTDQQASLIKELDGRVLSVVENQNGNHVIQKAIERIPGEHIQFIVNAHLGHVHYLSKHSYGCRVIQRMLEHCSPHAKRQILDELHADIGDLIQDAFGNYVVQHVIVNGEAQDRKPVIDKVQSRLLENAMHKFASNVVEKAIDYAQEDQRHAMVRKLTGRDEHGQSQVIKLLSHQYGNYVIQKCAAHLNGQTLQSLVEEMEQYLMQLRRVSTGKQVTALESSIRDARQRLHNQRQEDPLHHVAFRPKSSTMRR